MFCMICAKIGIQTLILMIIKAYFPIENDIKNYILIIYIGQAFHSHKPSQTSHHGHRMEKELSHGLWCQLLDTMKNNMFLPMVISWETLNYIMFPTTGNLHVSSTWET